MLRGLDFLHHILVKVKVVIVDDKIVVFCLGWFGGFLGSGFLGWEGGAFYFVGCFKVGGGICILEFLLFLFWFFDTELVSVSEETHVCFLGVVLGVI
jgi:hypothetical protein